MNCWKFSVDDTKEKKAFFEMMQFYNKRLLERIKRLVLVTKVYGFEKINGNG